LDRQIFCITSLIGQKVTASLRNNALISERVGALSIGTEVNANQKGGTDCSIAAALWFLCDQSALKVFLFLKNIFLSQQWHVD
jgi:hypothetical protein